MFIIQIKSTVSDHILFWTGTRFAQFQTEAVVACKNPKGDFQCSVETMKADCTKLKVSGVRAEIIEL